MGYPEGGRHITSGLYHHIADPRTKTVKITCSAHDEIKTLSGMLRDRQSEIKSRSEKRQKVKSNILDFDRHAESNRTASRKSPVNAGPSRVAQIRSGASDGTQMLPAKGIIEPNLPAQKSSGLSGASGLSGMLMHELSSTLVPFGKYNVQNPPVGLFGSSAPSLPPGDYVSGTLINNWRDFHSRLSTDPDKDLKQKLILSDSDEWTCWNCGSGVGGRPADNVNQDGSEWEVTPEYVEALDNWTRFGTHICSDNSECKTKREDVMKDRSVNVRCVNTQGCMADFAYLDNDIGSQGFRVQDIDDPAKTYHCCSPPCQASISLLMADREYRTHRRLDLAKDIKDGSTGKSKRSREVNVHPLSSGASSSPFAPASTAGSIGLSHLDLDLHSTQENDREGKRRAHYNGKTPTHSRSGWTAVNL